MLPRSKHLIELARIIGCGSGGDRDAARTPSPRRGEEQSGVECPRHPTGQAGGLTGRFAGEGERRVSVASHLKVSAPSPNPLPSQGENIARGIIRSKTLPNTSPE